METNYVNLLYDTDIWGSHSSKENLGVFSNINEALYSLVSDENFETTRSMKDRLKSYFKKDGRLFIDSCEIGVFEGFAQVFDSEIDYSMNELKRIIFFEVINRRRDELANIMDEMFDSDVVTIKDIIEMKKVYNTDDITDDMLETVMDEDHVKKIISLL